MTLPCSLTQLPPTQTRWPEFFLKDKSELSLLLTHSHWYFQTLRANFMQAGNNKNGPRFPFLILFPSVSLNASRTPGTLTYHSPQEDKLFPQPHVTNSTVRGVVRPGCESWLLQAVTQVTFLIPSFLTGKMKTMI